jgi:hypothetical protein
MGDQFPGCHSADGGSARFLTFLPIASHNTRGRGARLQEMRIAKLEERT